MSSCSPLDWLVIFAKFAQEKSFFRITKTAKVAHGSAQVYHSRKRAPFSDSCVSSGRSQAMLCMLSTWDHAGPIAVCGHGGYCCFRLLLLLSKCFVQMISDGYTLEMYLTTRYDIEIDCEWDTCRYLCLYRFLLCSGLYKYAAYIYIYRCFCKLTRNNERSCQDEEIAA